MKRFKRLLLDALILALAAAAMALYLNSVRLEGVRHTQDDALVVEDTARARELEKHRRPIYDALAAAAKSVEGIVFWGDASLTVNRMTSLPGQLYNRIEDALISPVFARLVEVSGPVNYPRSLIPIVNMGVENEGIGELLCRAGVREIRVGRDYEMRPDVMARDIELVDENGRRLLFALQRYAGFGNVSIQGVVGALYQGSDYYDNDHPFLAFGRFEEGEAGTIPAGTVVSLDSQQKYRRYRTVLFFGEHPEIGDEALVQCMRELLARQAGHEEQYAVVCTTGEGSALDQRLIAAFGDHYVRNDHPPEEMSVARFNGLSQRVYAVLDRYGAFDAVKQGREDAIAAIEAMEAVK